MTFPALRLRMPARSTTLNRAAVEAALPLRHWGARHARRLFVTDVLAFTLGAFAAHAAAMLRFHLLDPMGWQSSKLTLIVIGAWLAVLSALGSRDLRIIGQGAEEYKRVLRGTLPVFAILVLASYLFRLHVPRTYVLVMMPVGLLASLAGRFAWRRWLHRRRGVGKLMIRVLAVGDPRTVRDLVRDLARAPMSGYRVVGACVSGADTPDDLGVPVVGNVDDVLGAVRRTRVDAVAVTASGVFGAEAVRRLSWELEDTGTDLMLAPALTNIAGPRVHTQPVGGLPLIHVDGPTYQGANRQLKRCFDVIGAGALLVAFAPVMVAVAIAVRTTTPGPALFRQLRAGIQGRSFSMLKYRSMVSDAESRLDSVLTATRDAGNTIMFKAKNDPRITSVGRFIRRYSLDELPQLLNVLKGDMSLVGPRPPLMTEVALYGADARRRMLVKPGITGLWQVSGRSDLTWDDTVRLDAFYVENWSITGDLVILWKTARAVASSSGAY